MDPSARNPRKCVKSGAQRSHPRNGCGREVRKTCSEAKGQAWSSGQTGSERSTTPPSKEWMWPSGRKRAKPVKNRPVITRSPATNPRREVHNGNVPAVLGMRGHEFHVAEYERPCKRDQTSEHQGRVRRCNTKKKI